MKKILVLMIVCMFAAGGAHAADSVSERASCADMQAEISTLASAGDLGDADAARLKTLRAQYRRTCQASAAGRATNSRAVINAAPAKRADEIVAAAATDEKSLLETIQEQKQENCIKLQDAIESQKAAETPDTDELDRLQAQYDVDCVEKPAEPEPEISAEELAEQIAANIDKGLCADGSKPNKYGCCDGEKFKDLGNLNFACCKADTDECYPPIK